MMTGLLKPLKSAVLRAQIAHLPRTITSSAALRKDSLHPGTDIQEDSSADAKALDESMKVAKEFEAVRDNLDHEKEGEPKRNPEVADKSGKSFPHQTDEQRASRKASNTEGEAQVKTREYTPAKGSQMYEDKK